MIDCCGHSSNELIAPGPADRCTSGTWPAEPDTPIGAVEDLPPRAETVPKCVCADETSPMNTCVVEPSYHTLMQRHTSVEEETHKNVPFREITLD